MPMPSAATHGAKSRKHDLVYRNDLETGILRKGGKGRFFYVGPKGKVTDDLTLERIRHLAIPPAWRDVWIASEPEGHIQAIGRDLRGRRQYRYHPLWTARRDEVKYGGLTEFADLLPTLRERVAKDLRRRSLSRERVVASVVWLLDNALIRIGNAAYARDNKSFGLTTLRDRHVAITGATLRFSFRGKSGKDWNLKLSDQRIARVVRGVQELPGQHLFQYIDEDGVRQAVHSQDVNDYIRDALGADFSSKNFRTWAGTVRAATLLADVERPAPVAEARRMLNGVIDAVAGRLGNTRAVCRRCYIHPRVIEAWEADRLGEEMAQARRHRPRRKANFDADEALVLTWLKRNNASARAAKGRRQAA